MTRLFFGFLLIVLINKQTSSFEIFGIDFDDIKNVYEYLNKVYMKTEELRESPTLEVENDGVALHEIMSDLKGLSQQLIHIQNDEDVKLDTIVRVLLDNIDVSNDLQVTKTDLIRCINYVDHMYERGVAYASSEEFSDDVLQDFVNMALRGPKSLEQTVAELYSLIFPGKSALLRPSFQSLSLSFVTANYERLCDKYISAQQRMYYIFMIIIDTHLKAFTTITQAYSLRFKFGGGKYRHEYGILKLMFHDQLTDYFEEFTRVIRYFPRDIRRCEVSRPNMGVNILEFEGLFQVVVNTESAIRKKLHLNPLSLNYATGSCENIKADRREQFAVYDCKTVDSIRGCPVINSDGILRFSWWQTALATSGHPRECPVSLHEIVGHNAGWAYNDVCTCSLNYTDEPLRIYRFDEYNIKFAKPKIMKISVEPQMSDIENNMIVVGVQFIVHDGAIHLQIQQSKMTQGNVPTIGTWKPVDVDNNNKKISVQYDILFDRRNIMNLDDVGVDPGYVVTGVKLQLNKERNGYELNVHGTKLMLDENKLGASQTWFKPGEYPIDEQDYQRKRSEIFLKDPDDPSLIGDYHPDPQANKFIQFRHSSIEKDGGYHTVPFIDAQPVTVSMHSPLGGIGLFYRRRDGYGGYIAPRLFTHDHVQVLEASIKEWKEFDIKYRKCYDTFNITQWNTNCTLFERSPQVNTETIDHTANISHQPDSTSVLPRHGPSNDTVGIIPGDFSGNHSDIMNSVPTSTGQGSTTIRSTHSDTDNSASIVVTQPTSHHLISEDHILNVSSSPVTESTRPKNDIPVTLTDSLQSVSKHNTTKSLPYPAHNSSPFAVTLPPTITYPPTVKSPNLPEKLPPPNGPSRVNNDRFINTKSRSKSDMYRRRLRRIERPLKVLRRDKSSIIYICDTNIISYEPFPPRSGFKFSVNAGYNDENMSNSIPMFP